MDVTRRRELARRALDGYVSGPAAPVRATAHALAKVNNAVTVVLVEGISDQIESPQYLVRAAYGATAVGVSERHHDSDHRAPPQT